MNLKIPQATKKGYIEVCPYGAFDWAYPNSKLRRGRVQGGVISAPLSFAKTKSMSMSQYPLNPEPDGTSRTIKANYWKVSRANFIRGGGYGATAVICVDDRTDMEIQAKRNGV